MLVSERGLSSVFAGGALSGAAVGWFVGSWIQGRPTLTITRDRLVVMGAAFTTTGLAVSSIVALEAVPWQLIAFTWAIGSFGMGILYGSLGVLVLQLSPPEEQGVNSAALQISDSLGVILATGLGGVIFATVARPGRTGRRRLPDDLPRHDRDRRRRDRGRAARRPSPCQRLRPLRSPIEP